MMPSLRWIVIITLVQLLTFTFWIGNYWFWGAAVAHVCDSAILIYCMIWGSVLWCASIAWEAHSYLTTSTSRWALLWWTETFGRHFISVWPEVLMPFVVVLHIFDVIGITMLVLHDWNEEGSAVSGWPPRKPRESSDKSNARHSWKNCTVNIRNHHNDGQAGDVLFSEMYLYNILLSINLWKVSGDAMTEGKRKGNVPACQ